MIHNDGQIVLPVEYRMSITLEILDKGGPTEKGHQRRFANGISCNILLETVQLKKIGKVSISQYPKHEST